MARGQALGVRCPGCKRKGFRPVASGRRKKCRYTHGNNTGLPDSSHKFEVTCQTCGYTWWSRHPDAEWAYDLAMKKAEEANADVER